MRISIIGLTGSGKSTAARKISKKLNIPYLQIDKLWFKFNGHKLNKKDIVGNEKVRNNIREEVAEFIKKESWISDGSYLSVQPLIYNQADQVIFLNISTPRRLLNHLLRLIFNRQHSDELTRLDEIKFFYHVIRRAFTQGPKMKKFVKENPKKILTFKSYKKLNKYIDNL